MHVPVQGNRRFLAGRDGVDDELLTRINVPADENVRIFGLVCERVGLDGLVGVERDLRSGEQVV